MDEGESEEVKKLIGVDMELHKPGKDADETEKREGAVEIIEDPERGRLNARQTMLKYKGGHSTGVDPEFPEINDIDTMMHGFPEDHFIDIFGDGSFTTPAKWWAAIGGMGIWIPDWNADGEDLPQRRERNDSAPSIGQTGSSTRMELAAWILVLCKPVRSRYATDSKSMLDKAIYLLKQAETVEEKQRKGEKVNASNPFKKAWGLQKDGDMWEIAWKAILRRGARNQQIRKVKGHATNDDVEKGKSTREDQYGNDKADKNADVGVEMVYGGGFAKLGQWLANRHSRYVNFMRRIQKMIAAVTLAEKDARRKAHECDKALLGYDPKKWQKTDARIRNKEEEDYIYEKLKMPPPVMGVHRFSYCKGLYLDIHKFLANRRWTPIVEQSTTSGITWLELFALFDVTGARTRKGDHVKDPKAKERADARNKKRSRQPTRRSIGNATGFYPHLMKS